ncbi:MAG: GNAT family N-acetyltransferase, partial [Okeania sp. SIO2D1]|nr:GNAT family N-acetyltransferase [Okeania sp. SIO2D1]
MKGNIYDKELVKVAQIRAATKKDLPAIAKLKLCIFKEAYWTHLLVEDAEAQFLGHYQQLYHQEAAQHFLIEVAGEAVACAGAFLKDDMPFCFFQKPFYGFIGDVYTKPEHRKQGYA